MDVGVGVVERGEGNGIVSILHPRLLLSFDLVSSSLLVYLLL